MAGHGLERSPPTTDHATYRVVPFPPQASQREFATYACAVVALTLLLIYRYAPRYGKSSARSAAPYSASPHPPVTRLLGSSKRPGWLQVHIYVLICSLVGSLSVVSLKVRLQLSPIAQAPPTPGLSSWLAY